MLPLYSSWTRPAYCLPSVVAQRSYNPLTFNNFNITVEPSSFLLYTAAVIVYNKLNFIRKVLKSVSRQSCCATFRRVLNSRSIYSVLSLVSNNCPSLLLKLVAFLDRASTRKFYSPKRGSYYNDRDSQAEIPVSLFYASRRMSGIEK